MSDQDYHSRPEISRSMLDVFVESPRLYHGLYVEKSIKQQTATQAMEIGTALHLLVLQRDLFHSKVAIIPNDVLNKDGDKKGAPWTAYAKEMKTDAIYLKEEEVAMLLGMAESVSKTVSWISDPKRIVEQPIYWHDNESNLDMRALPDFALPCPGLIVSADIKSTLSLKKFNAQVRFDYKLQHVHYSEALRQKYGRDLSIDFYYIPIEKTPPYRCRLRRIRPGDISRLHQEWRDAVNRLAKCYETGDWSDPDEREIEEIPVYFD